MPVETKEPGKSMGTLRKQHEIGLSSDSLQRALEMEIVSQLREQNAKLLSELETYRRHKGAPESGEGSTQSWVEVPSVGEGRDGHAEWNTNS